MDPIYSGPPIEARSAGGAGSETGQLREVEALLAEDPFFYGWRWVGEEQIPLTADDLLDPQEGDHVSEHTWHHRIVCTFGEILRELFVARGRLDVLVGGNLKMWWRNPKLKKIAPDIVVIPQVEDPGKYRKSFKEREEGTHAIFVLEVTSEATADTDESKKPGIYQRAEVEESFILDTLVNPWTLTGRRLYQATGRYRKIAPGAGGRLLAETLEVVLTIGADGKSVDFFDARSGEKLRDLHASEDARRVAVQRQHVAEQRQHAAEEEVRRLRALLASGETSG